VGRLNAARKILPNQIMEAMQALVGCVTIAMFNKETVFGSNGDQYVHASNMETPCSFSAGQPVKMSAVLG